MPKLKPRLRMAAELVRDGVRIADIGTDHAYLPAALILEGRITGAVAADLRKGPLENAAQTVRANGLTDRISLRLSDGLANVSAGEADDIVIAGMGGILIAEILGACPFLKDGSKRYILQPQSHSEELRAFLWSSGFRIFGESACFEDEKVYIAFCAEYVGEAAAHSDAEIYFGGYYKRTDEPSKAFTAKKSEHLRVKAEALLKSGADPDEAERLTRIINEVKSWQEQPIFTNT